MLKDFDILDPFDLSSIFTSKSKESTQRTQKKGQSNKKNKTYSDYKKLYKQTNKSVYKALMSKADPKRYAKEFLKLNK